MANDSGYIMWFIYTDMHGARVRYQPLFLAWSICTDAIIVYKWNGNNIRSIYIGFDFNQVVSHKFKLWWKYYNSLVVFLFFLVEFYLIVFIDFLYIFMTFRQFSDTRQRGNPVA